MTDDEAPPVIAGMQDKLRRQVLPLLARTCPPR